MGSVPAVVAVVVVEAVAAVDRNEERTATIAPNIERIAIAEKPF